MASAQSSVRVVIADNSDTAARFLERLLEEDPRIRVVGRARNGAELLALPQRTIAQVVILDVLMPELDSASILRRLTSETMVIAVSSEESATRIAEEMVSQGVRAFFCKRDLIHPAYAHRLRSLVKSLSLPPEPRRSSSIILVVGSTGAIPPLEMLLRDLRGVPVPILVVQHMPEGKEQDLVRLFCGKGHVAAVAHRGDALASAILIAPGGRHLALDARERVDLLDTPPIQGHRPSGEVLLRSAVPLGRRAIAVILSGLGNDGAEAMAALAAAGGNCLAQHPGEAAVDSMPRAALYASRCVRAVRTALLGRAVRRLVSEREERQLPHATLNTPR